MLDVLEAQLVKNIYRVMPYGNGRYSVDRVTELLGETRDHVSFSYSTRQDATRNMRRIIAEDNKGEPTPISAEWGTVNK